ncbi:hypothetical protein Taro_002863 [Colocasia esculenta]|uniref:Uncharacterized protein n=1 Tax=Colocasia esculenta TaxID=4460 RepID=A0A843TDX7_COLES|nr:hypothetical protein [Colocasia esculenta]
MCLVGLGDNADKYFSVARPHLPYVYARPKLRSAFVFSARWFLPPSLLCSVLSLSHTHIYTLSPLLTSSGFLTEQRLGAIPRGRSTTPELPRRGAESARGGGEGLPPTKERESTSIQCPIQAGISGRRWPPSRGAGEEVAAPPGLTAKLLLNSDQNSTKVLILTVLQGIDPFVEEILITAAHVTFYEFNIDHSHNQWL